MSNKIKSALVGAMMATSMLSPNAAEARPTLGSKCKQVRKGVKGVLGKGKDKKRCIQSCDQMIDNPGDSGVRQDVRDDCGFVFKRKKRTPKTPPAGRTDQSDDNSADTDDDNGVDNKQMVTFLKLMTQKVAENEKVNKQQSDRIKKLEEELKNAKENGNKFPWGKVMLLIFAAFVSDKVYRRLSEDKRVFMRYVNQFIDLFIESAAETGLLDKKLIEKLEGAKNIGPAAFISLFASIYAEYEGPIKTVLKLVGKRMEQYTDLDDEQGPF